MGEDRCMLRQVKNHTLVPTFYMGNLSGKLCVMFYVQNGHKNSDTTRSVGVCIPTQSVGTRDT